MEAGKRHLSDEEVISKLRREHDPELFSVLYKRYSSRIFEKCNHLLKDRQLAREFTQEVFTKVYENLDKHRDTASFASWLAAIAYNHCIEYLRSKRRMHYPEWNSRQELPETVAEAEDFDFSELKYERLMGIMDLIHPEEKALLLMKYQDNLPLRLIHSTLKISESAAKMRLKRARARVLYLYRHMYPDI
ncbi:MAG: sigma-70 family RNA polymerase sigma factor [Bacteroidales bacterium]|nr:sigma-70 family RNA polymerase sigma factor [Bacteroidales bacterium]